MKADMEIQQALVIKRDELEDLMEQDTRQAFNRVAKDRFQWGNKPGKYLARIIKNKKKSINYIKKIKNNKGDIVYTASEVARVFHNYYSVLYSVRQKGSQKVESKRKQKIQEYLREANLPKISVEKLQALDESTTQEKIRAAIKSTAKRKSPGPDGFMI